MSQKIASLYAELGAKTEGFEQGASKVKGGLTDLQGAMAKGVLTGNMYWDLLSKGINAVGAVMRQSVQEAANAQAVSVRLGAALRATGRDAEISQSQLENMASSLAQMSAFDDESIKSAYQALAQFENIPTDKMNAITKAAMDMTAAMGGDLASNAEQIGRILETGMIPRTFGFSVALRTQVQEQVKAGNTAAALSAVLAGLNARYSGQAAAQLDTYAGAQQHLTNAWNDYLESLGKAMLPGATVAQRSLTVQLEDSSRALDIQRRAMDLLGESAAHSGTQLRNVMAILVQNERGYRGRGANYTDPAKAAAEQAAAIAGAQGTFAEMGLEISGPLIDSYEEWIAIDKELKDQLAKSTNKKERKELLAEIEANKKAYLAASQAAQEEMKIQEKAKELFPDITKAGRGYAAILEERNKLQKAGMVVIGGAAQAAEEEREALLRAGKVALASGEQMDKGVNAGMKTLQQTANNAAKEVAEARRQLDAINGMEVFATVYIDVIGGVPLGQVGGGTSGGKMQGVAPGGYQWRPRYTPLAGGGKLNGWTLVGDKPGGIPTPWSELITPDGVVIPAKATQQILASGAVQPKSAAGGIPAMDTSQSSRTLNWNINMKVNGHTMSPSEVQEMMRQLS